MHLPLSHALAKTVPLTPFDHHNTSFYLDVASMRYLKSTDKGGVYGPLVIDRNYGATNDRIYGPFFIDFTPCGYSILA